jgi:hypothetical protein
MQTSESITTKVEELNAMDRNGIKSSLGRTKIVTKLKYLIGLNTAHLNLLQKNITDDK